VQAHVSKAAALAGRHDAGMAEATDVMMIVLAAALSWNTTAAQIRNPLDEDADERRSQHRAAVVKSTAAVANVLLAGRPKGLESGFPDPERP
jgi:hypothetical protein